MCEQADIRNLLLISTLRSIIKSEIRFGWMLNMKKKQSKIRSTICSTEGGGGLKYINTQLRMGRLVMQIKYLYE